MNTAGNIPSTHSDSFDKDLVTSAPSLEEAEETHRTDPQPTPEVEVLQAMPDTIPNEEVALQNPDDAATLILNAQAALTPEPEPELTPADEDLSDDQVMATTKRMSLALPWRTFKEISADALKGRTNPTAYAINLLVNHRDAHRALTDLKAIQAQINPLAAELARKNEVFDQQVLELAALQKEVGNLAAENHSLRQQRAGIIPVETQDEQSLLELQAAQVRIDDTESALNLAKRALETADLDNSEKAGELAKVLRVLEQKEIEIEAGKTKLASWEEIAQQYEAKIKTLTEAQNESPAFMAQVPELMLEAASKATAQTPVPQPRFEGSKIEDRGRDLTMSDFVTEQKHQLQQQIDTLRAKLNEQHSGYKELIIGLSDFAATHDGWHTREFYLQKAHQLYAGLFPAKS